MANKVGCTLDELHERFPYQVGDKVLYIINQRNDIYARIAQIDNLDKFNITVKIHLNKLGEDEDRTMPESTTFAKWHAGEAIFVGINDDVYKLFCQTIAVRGKIDNVPLPIRTIMEELRQKAVVHRHSVEREERDAIRI